MVSVDGWRQPCCTALPFYHHAEIGHVNVPPCSVIHTRHSGPDVNGVNSRPSPAARLHRMRLPQPLLWSLAALLMLLVLLVQVLRSAAARRGGVTARATAAGAVSAPACRLAIWGPGRGSQRLVRDGWACGG